jgi:hypothetical protein
MMKFYSNYGHEYLAVPQEKKDVYKEQLCAEHILKEQAAVRKLGPADLLTFEQPSAIS